jgi:hypothetical protein
MTQNHIVLKLFAGAVTLATAAFMATMIPELRRYVRMRRM